MTPDEWKLTSPHEDQPEPVDEGDLADEAYERENNDGNLRYD